MKFAKGGIFTGTQELPTDPGELIVPEANMIKTLGLYDVVKVVRCKDCKHWLHMEDGMGDCTHPRFHLEGSPDPTMSAEEFCCLGERRAEDGK